ncbi:MAG: hypothetical protein ACNA7V_14325 [Bacteroidales bacterium]
MEWRRRLSGEVVALPILPIAIAVAIPVIAVGAVGVAVYGANAIINRIVDRQIDAVVRAKDQEKARLKEWHVFQSNQLQQIQEVHHQYEAFRAAVQKLSSTALLTPEIPSAGKGTTTGAYYSLKAGPEQPSVEFLKNLMDEVITLLDSAPESFIKSENSPISLLKKQEQVLKNKLKSQHQLHLEEIESFRQTVIRTISGHLQTCEKILAGQSKTLERLDQLFDDVCTTILLQKDSSNLDSLNKIKEAIFRILEKKPIYPGDFEHLEKRVSAIKEEALGSLYYAAFRSTLAQSLTRNLEEMGYDSIEMFPEDPHTAMMRAEMAIPGGERLRLTIDRKNQMSFRVHHESSNSDTPLTAEEKRFFRAQEKKWCDDMKDLIRRLTEEGFAYKIGPERLIPDMSIPVIVTEDIDSILAKTTADNKQSKRRRKQAQQVRRTI